GSGREVERYGWSYRPGDKVLQTINNYQKEVYNGDIGRVLAIDETDQELTVDFDGRSVIYDFGELDELALAYAMSVHKSQGSEYPAVIIPLHTQHYLMLQRNLLYTGVTRGKRLVVLVGSRKALATAVKRPVEVSQRLRVTAFPIAEDAAIQGSGAKSRVAFQRAVVILDGQGRLAERGFREGAVHVAGGVRIEGHAGGEGSERFLWAALTM